MKWTVENLFKDTFIRPKGNFKKCYAIYCKSKNKFYIYDGSVGDIKYKGICKRCKSDKCYDPDDDCGYGDTIPSYLMDFDMLQLVHQEHILGYPRNNTEKGREFSLEYYKTLKQTISRDPYFRHLKRVANRKKFKK